MAYKIVATLMALNDLRGHSPTASLFKWYFSYSYACMTRLTADDKISTDMSCLQ